MKAAIYDPLSGRRLGLTSLKRDIVPGLLKVKGWTAGTYLGEPVIRRRSLWYASDIRKAYADLRHFIELTGWSARVELTSKQARTLGKTQTVRLVHNGTRLQELAGHGKVTR